MANKYLHLFETEQDFQDAYDGNEYEEPWVSLVTATGKVDSNKFFFLDLSNYQYPEVNGAIQLSSSEAQAIINHIEDNELTLNDKIKILEPDENMHNYKIFEAESNTIGLIREYNNMYLVIGLNLSMSLYVWTLLENYPSVPDSDPDSNPEPIPEPNEPVIIN